MEVNSTIIILLIVFIVLLIVSLALFISTKYMKRLAKRRQAEHYRNKGSLLPIANPYGARRSMTQSHPCLSFESGESFRHSFYRQINAKSADTLIVPEIRITFPEEDMPPVDPQSPGRRTSRVVVVQVGESGAAYVTPPPAYDGFHDIDMEALGGLKEKH